jgi:hypothetical protein
MNYKYVLTWYELDQPVRLGQESDFYFFRIASPLSVTVAYLIQKKQSQGGA